MKDDALHILLKSADAVGMRAAAGRDADAADLVGRIRGRARRRRQLRWSLLTVLMMGIGGVVSFAVVPTGRNSVAQREDGATVVAAREAELEAELEALQASVAQLRREAERRERLVQRLLEAEQRERMAAAARRQAPSHDALAWIGREQDRAALILVHQAQRFDDELHKRTEAAETYRRVVALFPESQWADVARKRLVEMQG